MKRKRGAGRKKRGGVLEVLTRAAGIGFGQNVRGRSAARDEPVAHDFAFGARFVGTLRAAGDDPAWGRAIGGKRRFKAQRELNAGRTVGLNLRTEDEKDVFHEGIVT